MPGLRYTSAVLACGALVILAGSLADCGVGCSNTPVSETPSPGAELKAVVFIRNCGATAAFSTHVSILPQGAELRPRDGGNLFVADDNHGVAPDGGGGGPEVQVEWEGRNRLRLRHDPRARVFKAEHTVAGVRVEYVGPARDGT